MSPRSQPTISQLKVRMASPVVNDSVYLIEVLHPTGDSVVVPHRLDKESEIATGEVRVIVM